MTGLSFEHLLAYRDQETARWAALFGKNPDALHVACDIASQRDVAGLVYHIFAVERLHTERLLEVPTTPIEMGRPPEFDNWPALSGLEKEARAKIAQFQAKASDAELDKIMTIQSRVAGAYTTSKRKLFGHLLIHSTRHWAQLAPLLRQAGFKQDWMHDFLFTQAVK
jgi:uncharacterized damage-inducible protein DinB